MIILNKYNALICCLFILNSICQADTIYVPGDYGSIQDAIIAANDGDEIMVDDGIYYENIYFLGKNITVKSINGPENTIIDGSMLASVVFFIYGETTQSIIDGFTIQNGVGTYISPSLLGGGILCQDSSPIIRNNVIENNG